MIVEPNNSNNSVSIPRNIKLKEDLKKLLTVEPVARKSTLVRFSPDNKIFSGFNCTFPEIQNIDQKESNDLFFIQKISSLVRDKSNNIVASIHNIGDMGKVIASKFSLNLRLLLEDIVQKLRQSGGSNFNLLKQAQAYLAIWSIFDYFVVNDSLQYLLKIREIFYRYLLETDLDNFELFKKQTMDNYENDDSIESGIGKIFFCLRLCDFTELINLFSSMRRDIHQNPSYLLGTEQDFTFLLEICERICNHYDQIIESEFIQDDEQIYIGKSIMEDASDAYGVIESIKEKADQINRVHSRDYIFQTADSMLNIINILAGDIHAISNTAENYKEIILMHIYYRFKHSDFHSVLKESLMNLNEQSSLVDNLIIDTITRHPFEYYQTLKGSVPKWLQFHFMDVLFDLDLLVNQTEEAIDGLTMREYDYVNFLDYLSNLEINYIDFLNYTILYDSTSDNTYINYIERVVKNNAIRASEKMSDERALLTYLKGIFNELGQMSGTIGVIQSLAKILYRKFVDEGLFLSAVHIYSLAYLNSSEITDNENLLDLILYKILTEKDSYRNDNEKLRKFSGCEIEKKNKKIEFLVRIWNFLDLIDRLNSQDYFGYDAVTKTRYFFDYFFVQAKCPPLMWLWTMNLFIVQHQNNIELFSDLKYEDYKEAFSNHCKNETRIKNEMKKYLHACDITHTSYVQEYLRCKQFLFESHIYAFIK